MAEYIEREALLKSLAQECRDCEHDDVYDCEVCDFAIAMLYARHEPAADVQPVNRWISVEDRLPPVEHLYDTMTCICCTGKGYVVPLRYVYTTVRKKEVRRWERMDGVLWGDDVSYWQPLPEPPEECD